MQGMNEIFPVGKSIFKILHQAASQNFNKGNKEIGSFPDFSSGKGFPSCKLPTQNGFPQMRAV